MASPRTFAGQNSALGPPKGMEDTCGTLPIHFTGTEFISCWELDKDEMAQIAEAGLVWLRVAGQGHPPVMISGLPMMVQSDENGKPLPYDINQGLPESLALTEQARWRDSFIRKFASLIAEYGIAETPELIQSCIKRSEDAWNNRNPDMTPEQIAQAEYSAFFPG